MKSYKSNNIKVKQLIEVLKWLPDIQNKRIESIGYRSDNSFAFYLINEDDGKKQEVFIDMVTGEVKE